VEEGAEANPGMVAEQNWQLKLDKARTDAKPCAPDANLCNCEHDVVACEMDAKFLDSLGTIQCQLGLIWECGSLRNPHGQIVLPPALLKIAA
jgi:hypothetical protein